MFDRYLGPEEIKKMEYRGKEYLYSNRQSLRIWLLLTVITSIVSVAVLLHYNLANSLYVCLALMVIPPALHEWFVFFLAKTTGAFLYEITEDVDENGEIRRSYINADGEKTNPIRWFSW